jgi:Protein of unknown function with PCYCGC motif
MTMSFVFRLSFAAAVASLAACAVNPSPANGVEAKGPTGATRTHEHGVMAPDVVPAVASQPTADPPDYATETPELEALYRWAAAHHQELQYIPCSCGCERTGHKDNWECFVQNEPTPGRYNWDPHAAGCWSCQAIALETKKLLEGGMAMPAIRRAIDKQFGPFSMQTKRPPETR